MKTNNKGFSILIGMFLIVILTLSAYVLLAYMVPFSKNTKGIENASKSYYYAYGGVEQALLGVKNRSSLTQELSDPMGTTSTGISYQTTSSGAWVPEQGGGNSDYDKNCDKIMIGSPIQLTVGGKVGIGLYTWNYFEYLFKVPAFTGGTIVLSGGTTPIINWSLSSSGETLTANNTSYITANEVYDSVTPSNVYSDTRFAIPSKTGDKLDGTQMSFQNFYNTYCSGPTEKCTLKFSIINPLKTTTGIDIPYLEYNFNPSGGPYGAIFPLYYTTINTSGKSYGFKKDLKVRVPQQTLNQAFDFTVFQ